MNICKILLAMIILIFKTSSIDKNSLLVIKIFETIVFSDLCRDDLWVILITSDFFYLTKSLITFNKWYYE